jgi:uncharacterized membrane protein
MLPLSPVFPQQLHPDMLYFCLKIIHILSATLLLTSMGYSYHLWKNMRSPRDGALRTERIQMLTWLLIIPLAITQLATGFTILSIQHEDFSQLWISASVIGFIIVIASWVSFIYFLLLSQQIEIKHSTQPFNRWSERGLFFRRIQSMLLSVCGLSILAMIFFMANKVA